jgi:hypothetical protein
MSDTPYTETEALLLALNDAEADSGSTELLDEYLRREFLPGELRKLERGADLLSYRASEIRRGKARAAKASEEASSVE